MKLMIDGSPSKPFNADTKADGAMARSKRPNRSIYLKLIIDGEPPKPFSADTIALPLGDRLIGDRPC